MVKFFVYFVESPAPHDLYSGRSETKMLGEVLQLNGIPFSIRTAVNEEWLGTALGTGVREAMKDFPDHLPIVHISSHGTAEGIRLTNGEFVSWETLRNILLTLNEAMENGLILCMSSCFGFSACRMAMTQNGEHPFYALIAHDGTAQWSDLATGFGSFYHLLSKGKDRIEAIIEAMKASSGSQAFRHALADEARAVYLEYLEEQKVLPSAVENQLE